MEPMTRLASYAGFEEEARTHIQHYGLPTVNRPGSDLHVVDGCGEVHEWPGSRLGDVPWETLSAWLGILSAWRAYMLAEDGVVAYILSSAKAEVKRRSAPLILAAEGKTVTEKKARVEAEPEIAALVLVRDEAERMHALIKSRAEGIEELYKAASREITRREAQASRAGPPAAHQRGNRNYGGRR